MRPGAVSGVAEARLLRNAKATVFLPALRRRLDEDHLAALLAVAIQLVLGAGQAALAELALLGPNNLARLEILANPALAIGIAVDVSLVEHHAAVVVDHVRVGVDFLGLEAVRAIARELDQVTAGAVAGGDVDVALMEDRRRDDGRAEVALLVAPQQLAVLGSDTHDSPGSQLDVLPRAAEVDRDGRGVTGRI